MGWTTSHATAIHFDYDDSGRLIQLVLPSASAQYGYDVAGNLLTVRTDVLAIAGFSPNSGAIASQVTIVGNGFSATAASNQVKVNGTAAVVTAATANSLTFTVPAGATSGKVTVTVAGVTATRDDTFSVVALPTAAPPVVSAVSTQLTATGSTVTISGSNFTGGDMWVRVNGIEATITSVSGNQITFIVPATATSGPLTVGSRSGGVSSPTFLFVPPSGSSVGNISSTSALVVDDSGAPKNVSIAAGLQGLYAFSAQQGQAIDLGVSGLASGQSVVVQVFAPDGSVFNTTTDCNKSFNTPGGSCAMWALPATGAYLLRVTASASSPVNLKLTLSQEINDTLLTNGDSLNYSTDRVGRRGVYFFNATAGDNFNLKWSGATLDGELVVLRPDGGAFMYSSKFANASSGSLNFVNLPVSGTYVVVVIPADVQVGQVGLTLSSSANGDHTLGTTILPTSVGLIAGQSIDFVLAAKQGDAVDLGLSNISQLVTLQVLKPDGTPLTTNIDCPSSFNGPGGSCAMWALPVAGNYTVRIGYNGPVVQSLILTASSEFNATLAITGASQNYNTNRVGQRGVYFFDAQAGSNAALSWTGSTLNGTWTVLKPNGGVFASTGFTPGSRKWDLLNLPSTGTYVAVLVPADVNTGQLNLTLTGDALGTVVVGGDPVTVNMAAGQNSAITFGATQGQNLDVGLSAMSSSLTGQGVTLQVFSPDGSPLIAANTDCMTPTFVAPGGSCAVWRLPTTGVYTLRLEPNSTGSQSVLLTISSEVIYTLPADGSAFTLASDRVGQRTVGKFTSQAGGSLSLRWTASTKNGSFFVLKPDLSYLNGANFTKGVNGALDLTNLPLSGDYFAIFVPSGVETGKIDVAAIADATGTTTVNGSTTSVTLLAGQRGDYVFSATQGQAIDLGISAMSSTPSAQSVTVQVFKPDGTALSANTDCNKSFSAPGDSCAMWALPSTGNYIVRVVPNGSGTQSLVVTLSPEMNANLTPDGSALNYSTARVGQRGVYFFTAQAGNNATLAWSGASFNGWILVQRPDGTQLSSGTITSTGNGMSGTLNLNNLSQSGTYVVVVGPAGVNVGKVTLKLTGDMAQPSVTNNDSADTPIPLWALIGLGCGLLEVMRRRRVAGSLAP